MSIKPICWPHSVTQITNTPNRQDAWQWAVDKLSNSDSPRLDSQLILCHVLGVNSASVMAWPDKPMTSWQWQTFQQLIERRCVGEPVAYILGEQGFWSLSLITHPSTLIPRPETELLVETVLALPLSDTARCIDLGTGTGAIGLALASEKPNWQLLGIDQSVEAVTLAQRNQQRNIVHNIVFQQGNWLDNVTGTWHCIVSNPPYIDSVDPHLQQGDVAFEPRSALVAEAQGLGDILTITAQSTQHLVPDGWLVFEHGYQQGAKVRQVMAENGFQQVVTKLDLNSRERVTLGRLESLP